MQYFLRIAVSSYLIKSYYLNNILKFKIIIICIGFYADLNKFHINNSYSTHPGTPYCTHPGTPNSTHPGTPYSAYAGRPAPARGGPSPAAHLPRPPPAGATPGSPCWTWAAHTPPAAGVPLVLWLLCNWYCG